MPSVLQKVAERAKELIPGVDEASVTLVERGVASSAMWTGLLAFELDEVHFEMNFGPCVTAAISGEVQAIPDTRRETRWPEFSGLAASQGALSTLSTPIPIQHDIRAGLNLYATAVAAFGEQAQRTAFALCSRAAVAISNMLSYDESKRTVQNLQEAMTSRAVIEQAKGIVMSRKGLPADEAFLLLSHESQRTNRKLRDLAAELVDSVVPRDQKPSHRPR